jgi:hypothetical protein
MKNILNLSIIAFISIALFGCGKVKEKVEEKVKVSEKSKQEAEKQVQADSIKESVAKENEKQQKVMEALDEEKIVNDENGQWASEADASSTYAGENAGKNASWSPNQMAGKPDVEHYGDDGRAWAPKDQDKGIEWVKLTFPKAVNATDVRIRQTLNPGSIIKIELIDTDGKSHTVWEGVDKTKYEADKIKYFIASFDKTPYKTKVVKITLATNSVPGWNEIDAVQLVGSK